MALAAKIFASVFLLFTAAAVGISAWSGLMLGDHPDLVLTVMPQNASALRKLADSISSGAGNTATPSQKLQIARRLIRSAPMSDAPLILAAQSGAIASVDAAYREALRRNPRNVAARVEEAEQAASSGNYDRAFYQLSRLFAIAPDKNAQLTQASLVLAKTDGGVAALKPYVIANQHWAADLVRQLNNSDLDLGQLYVL